jgi:hypothetical protein
MQQEIELDIRYEDFHAYHDHMSKTLHVTGVCQIEGGGFAAQLEPHQTPTANPLMVDLDLVVSPTGESPSAQPVDWRQAWDDDGYQYTGVDFFVRGVRAEAPAALDIEDVQ